MRDLEEVKECFIIIKGKLDESNEAINKINIDIFEQLEEIKERLDKLEALQTIR